MHNLIFHHFKASPGSLKAYANIIRNMCSKTSDTLINCDRSSPETNRPMYKPEDASIDEPPTTCCMSGCHNCVYIAWADALSKKMAGADPVIAKKVLENIEDPSMKAFLRMELKSLGLL